MSPRVRLFLILLVAILVGVAGGLFGIGGGALLVPLLVALVPPTGILAFVNYAHAGEVNWIVGLLIMPGVFFGAMAGTRLAQKLSSLGLRRTVAVLIFVMGLCEVSSIWRK